MPRANANGLSLEYEIAGPESGEVVLFIAGHAGQLTAVPDVVMEALVRRGFRVIRFDNRDVGLSTKFDEAGPPDWPAIHAALEAGRRPPVAYDLSDMARDAVGLLDALGIDKAHVIGGSMGGMIAQLVAAEHPERVMSLVSFISTSSNPDLPGPTPEALAVMSAPIEPADDFDAIVEFRVRIFQTIGSRSYPTPVEVLRERIGRDVRRSYDPDGYARQSAAIAATGDRRARLRTITAPTIVLHGADDPLLTLEGARDTADNIPGAELRVVEGMGHDFPEQLAPLVAETIQAAADRARRPSGT